MSADGRDDTRQRLESVVSKEDAQAQQPPRMEGSAAKAKVGDSTKSQICLRGISDAIKGQAWTATDLLRIGRLKSLEIVLDDSSVSRFHAQIRLTEQGWVVSDCSSTNGSWLNGIRLESLESPLRQRDLLQCGKIVFWIESIAGPGETGPQSDSPSVPIAGNGDAPNSSQAAPPSPGEHRILWKVAIKGNRPLATPAIANGKVFVGGGFGSHEFYAFAMDTGKELWSYRTKDDGPTAAIVIEDLVAFNTESCELEVLTVEGAPVWKRWLGDPLMSMPAAGNGRLFIVYPDSQGDRRHYLGCFQLRTGNLLWRHPVTGAAITAPVLSDGNVYLTSLDGSIWCFHQDDGTPLWMKARNATSSPSIWNNTCYYSRRQHRDDSQNECVSSSELGKPCRDFERTWCRADYLDYSRRASDSRTEASSQTLDGTVGFHSWKGDSDIGHSQTNLGHGTVAGVWSFQGSRPFVIRDRLYNCMGRFVQCLDPLSDNIIWKTKIISANQPILDHMLTPPVIVNHKVFVATASGEVICLCAATGARLWRQILGEAIHFQPVVAQGRLYVPTATGSLYCLETGNADDDGWTMWGGTAAHNGVDDSQVPH